ncbi:hypothetical protein [Actinoplanes sp. NPDC026670]|uniref:hypothetical protein n=1 Tax=Actinoplanes sp. NPDC026670 TaxID=3154700 RepID=UPI0033DC1865
MSGLLRVAVSSDLDPVAAAVQSSHVTALIAAALPDHRWDATTFVLHTIGVGDLIEVIRSHGGHPAASGTITGTAWFAEPDLLWEPTAVATTGDAAGLQRLPLLAAVPAAAVCGPRRRWLAKLAADTVRSGITGAQLWDEAADLGNPADRRVRVRAAHLMVRGREPP